MSLLRFVCVTIGFCLLVSNAGCSDQEEALSVESSGTDQSVAISASSSSSTHIATLSAQPPAARQAALSGLKLRSRKHSSSNLGALATLSGNLYVIELNSFDANAIELIERTRDLCTQRPALSRRIVLLLPEERGADTYVQLLQQLEYRKQMRSLSKTEDIMASDLVAMQKEIAASAARQQQLEGEHLPFAVIAHNEKLEQLLWPSRPAWKRRSFGRSAVLHKLCPACSVQQRWNQAPALMSSVVVP